MGYSEWDIERGWRDTPSEQPDPRPDPRRIPWPQPQLEIIPVTPERPEIDPAILRLPLPTRFPEKKKDPKPVIH